MSTRAQVLLWIAQRASAAVLALAVAVHLVTLVAAVRGGLSAAEILGRLQGSAGWLAFYVTFVLAAAVHAPIGLRTVLRESSPLGPRACDGVAAATALVLLVAGLRAVLGLWGYPGGWRVRGIGRASNRHPAYWAFVVHRVSGLALTAFLPVHFWALGLAIRGEAALDGFLRWSDRPLVKAAETALVVLLAAHLAGGLRLLAIEWLPWTERQRTLLAAAAGITLAAGLAFALNLA